MIDKITVKNLSGYILVKSCHYQAQDVCNHERLDLAPGINTLPGEIDSGNWAASYALSMWKDRSKDFLLTQKPYFFINGKEENIKKILPLSCYMDRSHPLFKTQKTVADLVKIGCNKNHLNFTQEELRNHFEICSERFHRPLSGTGTSMFRCMAAIGVAWDKSLFCFPWLSKVLIDYYGKNLTVAIEQLSQLQKIVILPFDPA